MSDKQELTAANMVDMTPERLARLKEDADADRSSKLGWTSQCVRDFIALIESQRTEIARLATIEEKALACAVEWKNDGFDSLCGPHVEITELLRALEPDFSWENYR